MGEKTCKFFTLWTLRLDEIYVKLIDFFLFQKIAGEKFFEEECIPDWEKLPQIWTDWDETKYPHPWRAAVLCFALGLGLMVVTDLFALLTVCCRSCICCSVFTICGSIQSFAGILFTLGKKSPQKGFLNDLCFLYSATSYLMKYDLFIHNLFFHLLQDWLPILPDGVLKRLKMTTATEHRNLSCSANAKLAWHFG